MEEKRDDIREIIEKDMQRKSADYIEEEKQQPAQTTKLEGLMPARSNRKWIIAGLVAAIGIIVAAMMIPIMGHRSENGLQKETNTVSNQTSQEVREEKTTQSDIESILKQQEAIQVELAIQGGDQPVEHAVVDSYFYHYKFLKQTKNGMSYSYFWIQDIPIMIERQTSGQVVRTRCMYLYSQFSTKSGKREIRCGDIPSALVPGMDVLQNYYYGNDSFLIVFLQDGKNVYRQIFIRDGEFQAKDVTKEEGEQLIQNGTYEEAQWIEALPDINQDDLASKAWGIQASTTNYTTNVSIISDESEKQQIEEIYKKDLQNERVTDDKTYVTLFWLGNLPIQIRKVEYARNGAAVTAKSGTVTNIFAYQKAETGTIGYAPITLDPAYAEDQLIYQDTEIYHNDDAMMIVTASTLSEDMIYRRVTLDGNLLNCEIMQEAQAEEELSRGGYEKAELQELQ